MSGYSPKLPLYVDTEGSYALNKNVIAAIKQNLKMVVLTNPGERVMIPDFGVGIRRYLFENATQQLFDEIEQRINQQARVYLPYISIKSVRFLSESSDFTETQLAPSSLANYMYISIRYTILSANVRDTLILQI